MSGSRERRRLAAILAADFAGYTRAMAEDEAGTLSQIRRLFSEVVRPAIAEQEGRIFKEMGDGILAEFPSAVRAAQAAAKIQAALAASNSPHQLRIGLHVGDVIVEDEDLFGDGVNIAARLQAVAEPGSVFVSDDFRRHTEGRMDLEFIDLGTRSLKNVDKPIRVHSLRLAGAPPMLRSRFAGSRRLVLTGSALALLLAAIWAGGRYFAGEGGRDGAAKMPGQPSIAVLPFENLTQDLDETYFADGIAEDLITDLSKIRGIRVISRTTSFAFRDDSIPVDSLAERLKVRFIVEGSVRRAGGLLRITTSLIDTVSDTLVWAERFDGSNADIFAFQDRITGEIVAALKLELTPAEQQSLENRGTKNPDAFDAYLRGLRLLAARRKLDAEANLAAQTAFQDAINLDPNYALAYAGLAWAKWLYFETINYYQDPGAAFALAEQSLSLAANALAHRTLSNKYFTFLVGSGARDPDRALAELEAARELQPNDPDILADLTIALCFAGRPEDGLRYIRRAMELNPSHPSWYFAASGLANLLSHNTEHAVRDLSRWSASAPAWNTPYLFLAAAHGLAGNTAAAKTALETYKRLTDVSRLSAYAVKYRWPMKPQEQAILLQGLTAAGLEEPQS